MVRKRIAITISGAVSLGSYEAGVMYEIISAFKEHNLHPDTTEQEKFEIDVLTGASAGGMTVAIAAQALLYDAQRLDGETSNTLYQPWVQDVSLQQLLAGKDDARFSILSSDLVENIARKYLTARYASGPPTPGVPHPAAADKIKLGLALSNLNGVNYSVQLQTGGDFGYTRFQDQYRQDLSTSTKDDLDTWEVIRVASLCCGAFPLAFRVQELQRQPTEYAPGTGFPKPDLKFAYTDGGVFQNEPLGLAKNLVDELDDHQNLDTRFYLYVSPHSKEMSRKSDFSAKTAMLFPMAKQLIDVIFHQAQFQDWVLAEEINDQVDLFNKRAEELKDALIKREITKEQLTPASVGLLNLFFPAPSETAQMAAEKTRLQGQFTKEYKELVGAFPDGNTAADSWISAILVLERSANLSDKDEMKIYGITAEDEPLAGNQFLSFGGFFDQKYRQNDYDVGRKKAREFLQKHVNDQNGTDFGPIRYSFPPFVPVQVKIPKNVKDLDENLRKELRDRVFDRAKDMLTAAGITGFSHWIVSTFYLSPKLNEIFGL